MVKLVRMDRHGSTRTTVQRKDTSAPAGLSTNEGKESDTGNWAEGFHLEASPLFETTYRDTLQDQAWIIDRACELIGALGLSQLMEIIDLLYQRLSSEKVPGEFFPFRESMYHLLLHSKWELKKDGPDGTEG